ncbi:hypothetical protein V6Z11_D04G121500 [Gossypium hirsutum]
MGSSLLQWESDPLFSAAEVVQDSADRMESIFRLLLHEQNLVEANNYDPKLLTLIGYHSRDLATILETAKCWKILNEQLSHQLGWTGLSLGGCDF